METAAVSSVPKEIVQLIPLFGGDKRQLNLYLRKCQYVIDRFKGSDEQNLYVFNVITSRLKDDAAALLSEREDIVTWSALKDLLIQHFGDPRSEACISVELESLKIYPGESFLDFCNRIQTVRSLLMSKVNACDDLEMKRSKAIIYNNTALNVFLYNLPEHMVRVIRLKAPTSLETALSMVLEEVNFTEQYKTRNRMHSNNQFTSSGSRPAIAQPFGYKPQLPPHSKFNFNNTQMPQMQGQGQPPKSVMGYRPQLGFQPQQFGIRPPHKLGYMSPQKFGYEPIQQFGYKPLPQYGYMPPQQFGYKPTQQFSDMPPQQFGYKPTQQFSDMPPQQLGYKPPQQFGYKPPQPQQQTNDVSMRTAQPKMQQDFKLNKLMNNEENNFPHDDYYENDYANDINFGYDVDTNQPKYSDASYHESEPTCIPIMNNNLNYIITPASSEQQVTSKLPVDQHSSDAVLDLIKNDKQNSNADALLKIKINALNSGKENPSPIVNVDEKLSHSDSSTVTISDLSRTATASSIEFNDKNVNDYPVRSESSKTDTIHSAINPESSGIPILNEAIDTKPNQILVFSWIKNEMQVSDLSRDKQKVLEVFLPIDNPELIKEFLIKHIKPKIKYFIYFEEQEHRRLFSNLIIQLFESLVIFYECTERVVYVKDEGEQRAMINNYQEGKTCHRGIKESLVRFRRNYYWDKMVAKKKKVREKKGSKANIQFSKGNIVFAKDVNKRKSRDKPRYVKAKVIGHSEGNILSIKVRQRKTKTPIKNIKHPPQVLLCLASSDAGAGPPSTKT
ncbi:uncharacterized protein LOC123867719 [Maniola jurtina]|uniref:uncharacterized protein LOC123867719 n=1 Tax=Maniola jurtina TaxID=191418 RepID=UPI001E689390|nr:uncharacterized protein LOC123867719 [Maniola jurtina]